MAIELQAAITALLGAQSVEDLERTVLGILPEAAGFERAAVLSLPTMQQPAQIVHEAGHPPLDLRSVAPSSPLAAGGFLEGMRCGRSGDGDAPHGDVRGAYVLAPLREHRRTVAFVYADALREDADLGRACAAAEYALDVAAVVRAKLNLTLERERLLAELDALARTDALTSLPNRRVFDERLEEELHRSARSRRPFGLAIFDLDRFKELNSVYGSAAGDEALQRFGGVLRGCARHVDLAARFGGDEFAMLLIDVDHRAAKAIVERVLDVALQSKLSMPVRLSASAGIELSYPVDTAESLIERAYAALYEAKQSGRDRTRSS